MANECQAGILRTRKEKKNKHTLDGTCCKPQSGVLTMCLEHSAAGTWGLSG